MTVKSLISTLTEQEDLNFLLTNRIPRAAATRFMGWFSKIENPLVRDFSIGLWRLFSDLDLSEAKKTHFKSLHDCFTRELKPGLRPTDPDPKIVTSPSDGIIGAFGTIRDGELFQIKGAPYSLKDLVSDPALVRPLEPGRMLADSARARELLGWRPTVSFEEMVARMVDAQTRRLKNAIQTR